MRKTFEALEKLVPGSSVIDIAFTILPGTEHVEVNLRKIDQKIADALENAEPADISTLI